MVRSNANTSIMNCTRVAGGRQLLVVIALVALWGAPDLAAQTTSLLGKSVYALRSEKPLVTVPRLRLRIQFPQATRLSQPDPVALRSQLLKTPTYRSPLLYHYDNLAFFCRLEVQLEQTSKIPVRFRLGSVDYVDYLEGKRSFY